MIHLPVDFMVIVQFANHCKQFVLTRGYIDERRCKKGHELLVVPMHGTGILVDLALKPIFLMRAA